MAKLPKLTKLPKQYFEPHHPHLIKINPPLPCSTVQGAGFCGRPAAVAHVWLSPDLGPVMDFPPPGPIWLMMPVCEECTRAMMAVYEEPIDN